MTDWNLDKIKEKVDSLGFEIDGGAHFLVLVFDDYVIKIPRNRKRRELMPRIAAAHNELAEEVDGAIPCIEYDGFIVMPKAPGVLAEELDKEGNLRVEELRDMYKKQARDLGWRLRDIKKRDMYYDEEEDTAYMVDFSYVREKKRAPDSARRSGRRQVISNAV